MSAWLIRTTVTPMQTVSILLAHTAASVNQVTKGPDSFVNVGTFSCKSFAYLKRERFCFLFICVEKVVSDGSLK